MTNLCVTVVVVVVVHSPSFFFLPGKEPWRIIIDRVVVGHVVVVRVVVVVVRHRQVVVHIDWQRFIRVRIHTVSGGVPFKCANLSDRARG